MGGISSSGKTILDAGQVTNTHISSAAADAIGADKLAQWRDPDTDFGFAIGATPSAFEAQIYVAKGSGTIRGFHGRVNAGGGSTSITMTLKKNGSSISSSPVTIGASTTTVQDGTLSSTTFVAGDYFSIAMAGTFTGAQGPYAWMSLVETNCPAT